MKSFDVFRKVNQDIETRSSSGGIFSIVAALCGLFLFYTEWKSYAQFEIQNEMFIDHDFDGDFKVNMNVTFLQAPCSVVSIGTEDEVGTLNVAVHQNLTFTRISAQNETLPNIDYEKAGYNGSQNQLNDLVDSLKAGEKCMVTGSFDLRKTPGNFHFSFKQRADLVSRLYRQDRQLHSKMDIDFTINSLYFGDMVSNNVYGRGGMFGRVTNLVNRKFSILGIYNIPDEAVDPYEGLTFADEGKKDYENHLSILPVELGSFGRHKVQQEVYQYNIYSGSLGRNPQDIPVAYFRYRMNPVNIRYEQVRKSKYHFVVNMLAIVGGIFALLGMIHSGALSALEYVKNMQAA